MIMFGCTEFLWLEDMPNVDRLYTLIMNIYLVREMDVLHMEEDLFAKLIFVFRSSEIAIKYTRYFHDPYNPEIIWNKEESNSES